MESRFSRSACMALALVAMILLPACQSAPASKPDALTYADTKNLPPETLKKRVLAQVGAIVAPAPPPPRWRPFERSDTVNDTWLATRPRLAEGGGFCTYDLIQVMLSPDNQDEDRTRNTPMHAIGVATTSWFSPVAANAKDCTSYDPATAHYFETDEPMSAGQDFGMLKDVLARMRSPTPGFAIDCIDMERCGDLKGDVTAETLWDIGRCYRPAAEGLCKHFSWRDPQYVEMDIIYDTPKLDRRIVRVHVEPGVIVN